MAWNEPGNGKDPWKRDDNEPNDLDQIVQNWQRRLGGLLGGGGNRAPGGAGGLILIVLLALSPIGVSALVLILGLAGFAYSRRATRLLA